MILCPKGGTCTLSLVLTISLKSMDEKVLLATSINGVATAAVTDQNIQESREVAQGVANWSISLSLMIGITW